MAKKAPVLTLDVGQSERHEVDVYYGARRRGVEVYMDGERVTPVLLRGATKDVERYELRVGGTEPHTVRIDRRRSGRGDTFSAYVDGWPVDGCGPDRKAVEVAASKTLAKADGPEKASKKAARYFMAGLLAGLCIWGVTAFVHNQINDASIASHGKGISARIVDTEHDTGDNGSYDYLYVWIPACHCAVRVDTDNPAAHPKGSTILVLYDTTNPTNARPLVDGNSTWSGWVTDGIGLVAGVFGLVCVYELLGPERRQLKRGRAARSSPSAVT